MPVRFASAFERGDPLCFALSCLLPDVFTSGTLHDNFAKWRATASDVPTRRKWDTVLDRWGSTLSGLYRILGQLPSADGIYEDAYHLALALALGREPWMNRSAWLSTDGLVPKLQEDLGFNLSWAELEAASSIPDRDGTSFHSGLPADLPKPLPTQEVLAGSWFMGGGARFFRGQKRTCPPWTLAASLDRELDASRRHALATRAASVAHSIAREDSISFDHALALVQHYSHELAVATRLLDVTVDPFIALYFAADPSPETVDACGVVYRWSHKELGENPELKGSLQLLMPPGEPRILRQRGLFLRAPAPWALEQTHPFELRFRQRPGLTFHDERRGLPPANLEPLSHWYHRLTAASRSAPNPSFEQTAEVLGPTDEGIELLSRCLLDHVSPRHALTVGLRGRLEILTRFHWKLTQSRIPPELLRSLRLVKQTADVITDPNAVPKDIPSTYCSQIEGTWPTGPLWIAWREYMPNDRHWPREAIP